MSTGGVSAKFVLDALRQARQKFGPVTDADSRDQQARWVRRRARELQDEHDGKPKAHAAGGER